MHIVARPHEYYARQNAVAACTAEGFRLVTEIVARDRHDGSQSPTRDGFLMLFEHDDGRGVWVRVTTRGKVTFTPADEETGK